MTSAKSTPATTTVRPTNGAAPRIPRESWAVRGKGPVCTGGAGSRVPPLVPDHTGAEVPSADAGETSTGPVNPIAATAPPASTLVTTKWAIRP